MVEPCLEAVSITFLSLALWEEARQIKRGDDPETQASARRIHCKTLAHLHGAVNARTCATKRSGKQGLKIEISTNSLHPIDRSQSFLARELQGVRFDVLDNLDTQWCCNDTTVSFGNGPIRQ